MNRSHRFRERLLALFVLGVVALLPPVLLVFNRPERVLGVPILYLYVLSAWTIVIALAAVIARRIDSDDPSEGSAVEPSTAERPRDA